MEINGIYIAPFSACRLIVLYIIITPADQIAFLNILNFLGSMQRGCLLGAQIAIILTISFTVLYAGYPYKIPGWGQKNLSCRGQGSNSGLFAPKSSVLTSTPYCGVVFIHMCGRVKVHLSILDVEMELDFQDSIE